MEIKKSLNRVFNKVMMEVCHALKLQNAFWEFYHRFMENI